jgi:hypothetical protein
MADAARAARGSFKEIKDGAKEAASETGYSMTEARHGVMMLGEEFGVHLPRGITSFLASIGPIGTAMEAAFPFLAIVVGATLLLEHLAKLREEAEKLTEAQSRFEVTTQNALNALDEKLLQAGVRADELNKDHLGALEKQLELIDKASFNELIHNFEAVAKAADVVFGELKTSWYQFGTGSRGAKQALDEFKREYDLLLAQGKDKEAADLLAGTKASAERTLAAQKEAQSNSNRNGEAYTDKGEYAKAAAAINDLKKAGVGFTEKEVEAQQALVDALNAQVEITGKIDSLKALQKSNVKTETGNKIDDEQAAVDRANLEAQKKEEELAAKEAEKSYREAVQRLQQNEREQVEATEKGSAERLAAIDAALKEEERYGLQETGFYSQLKTARVSLVREMTDEENKQRGEAGKEAASHSEKMAELAIASDKEYQALLDSAHRVSDAQEIAEAIRFADAEYNVRMDGYDRDIAALDKHGKDYENKLKALQDRQLELTREHENEVTQIRDKAAEARNARILSGEMHLQDSIAAGMTSMLMRHQTFGQMMVSVGDQVASGMIQNALKSIMSNDMTKESDAAAAARKAYLAGMHFPFPVNIVMGPALGALAFASVMAFEAGGIVPGVERGDIVPARLEPGEAVLPKNMTERLSRATGDEGDGKHVHVHHHASYTIHAIDGASVRGMLEKHGDEFARHATSHLRKMNF